MGLYGQYIAELQAMNEEKRRILLDNIKLAKENDPDAILFVLNHIDDRIQEYANLLYEETTNFNYLKSTHRYFIAEFEKEPGVYKAMYRKSKAVSGIAFLKFRYVQAICRQSMTKEDFKSECKTVALQLLKECKDYTKYLIYFGKSFHKRLANNIKSVIANDVLCHQELIEYDVNINDVYEPGVEDYKTMSFGVEPYDRQIEDLDSNWINGFTCNELFQCLTAHERLAIKLLIHDGIEHIKAAKILGNNVSKMKRFLDSVINKVKNQSYNLCECGNQVMKSARHEYIMCEDCIEVADEYNKFVDKYCDVLETKANIKINTCMPAISSAINNTLRDCELKRLLYLRKYAKINYYNNKRKAD
jgi:hypothetical protein